MKRALSIACGVALMASAALAKPKAEAPAPQPVLMSQLQDAVDANLMGQLKALIERAKLAQQDGSELTYYLSEYYLGTGALDQALAGFESVTGDEAVAARAQQGAGIAAYGLRRLPEAAMHLKAATGLDPNLPRAWNALGVTADATRDWALADTAYSEALRIAPGTAGYLSNRGYSRLLQRRDAEAIDDLTNAVTAEPGSEAIKNNLRIALALSGRYDDAIAGTDTRKLHIQLNNIGYAAMLRGDYATAESYFNQAIERSDVYYEAAHRNLLTLADLRRQGAQASVGN